MNSQSNPDKPLYFQYKWWSLDQYKQIVYQSYWTPEKISELNYEMAQQIINEIGEILKRFGYAKNVPSMFYPEEIAFICTKVANKCL